ncbi:DASH family cryptochrome, partial [Alishewanella sp. SMS9]|nr:DASH family cryptochrome [Alishewanella sp. SMS9]
IAGYGNSEARPFNMIKQALAYDPKADFVRHMLPELTAKDKTAHRPQANTPIPAQWHNWLKELD